MPSHASLREYSKTFLKQKDAYFRERVKDIYDIERRLISKLQGDERINLADLTEPVALVAHDLTPSQTASLDRTKVRAIVIDAGGKTSHTAIIANSMGIPAVVGLENITQEVNPGDTLIVNGQSGVVIINPDEATLEEHRKYEAKQVLFERDLDRMRDLPSRTKDGTEITLMGNIEFPHEIENALAKGATGIGLYRTGISFYLAADREPNETDRVGTAYAEAIKVARSAADHHPHARSWLTNTFLAKTRPGGQPFLGVLFHPPVPRESSICSRCSSGRCSAPACLATCA